MVVYRDPADVRTIFQLLTALMPVCPERRRQRLAVLAA
jgi:hypothetical protein